MFRMLRERAGDGIPVFGTCAGMVLLASRGDEQVEKTRTELLKLVDADVVRNAFGRQKESFEAEVDVKGLEKPYHAVFIRAPAYTRVSKEVKILSRIGDRIILCRRDNILASAFHPELTGDLRIHRLFLDMFH